MTQDEILRRIEGLSTEPASGIPSLIALSERVREVARLADAYREVAYDQGYLAEALTDAMERIADMILTHSL